MKTCAHCQQENPDEAVYCLRCGTRFEGDARAEAEATVGAAAPEAREAQGQGEEDLWRIFIGPSKALLFSPRDGGFRWDRADRYYLEQFRKFQVGPTSRFALTWHWPAFLIDPFLWFLYRKMYLYAAVYLVGPVIAFFLTGDVTVGFIWRVIAGASANYLYFWHIREQLHRLREQAGPFRPVPESQLRDAGGVQPYVFVLGIVLHLFVLFAILQGPPPDEALRPNGSPAPQDRPPRF